MAKRGRPRSCLHTDERRQPNGHCNDCQREYRHTGLSHARDLFDSARSRAKRRGFCCTISARWVAEQLRVFTHCPIVTCGREFKRGGIQNRSAAPSLDRRNPLYGYTETNTQLICWRCNSNKSDSTAEHLRALADSACANDWLAIPSERAPQNSAL